MESTAVEQLPQVKTEEPAVCGETSLNDFPGEVMDTGSRPSIQEIDSKHRGNNCQFLIGGTVRTSPAFSVSDPSRLAPYKNCSSASLQQHRGDPMLAAEQAGRKSTGSGRLYCKSGATAFGGPAVSPEFHSTSGTPNSISQLLAAFSGSDNLALEFPSPLGSGIISPLNSAKLGRKRALSISPLSTGSLDLSNLIRSSPTSLLNYITASRGSSAGSIGHLSPSVFANPATPLRSHILKHTPQHQQPRPQHPANDSAAPIPVELDVSKLKLEPVTASVDDAEFPGVYKDALKTLATVREEDGLGFEEEGDHATGHTRTVECDSTTTGVDGGGNRSGSGDEAPDPDHKAKRRVYYNYPNTEVPHHNQCLWSGCNVQFGTLDELVRHVNVDHIYRDSKKDFLCCWEGCVRERKAFKAQYMLLVHMRRHTGEKPHQCTFEGCNKAYSRLENLKTHLRSHTGEKPYTCKYKGCDKSFSNASDCAKHMNRTHSDEKPYACPNPGCPKRYTDPSSRRKHVKNCQVNKKPKAEDAMSGADEESCTEGTGAQSVPPPQAKSKATAGLGKKQEKPNKKKKAESNNHNPRIGEVPTPMADHGYETGGSQGYVSSQTGYTSSGYDTEYPSLNEDVHRQAVLPRPFGHVTSPGGHAPNPYLPMNRPGIGHVTDKAVRNNGMGTDPKRAPPSYGAPPPPAMYHPYPLQADPLLLSNGCPPNDRQCVVHYTVPVGNVGGAQHSRHPDQGPSYVTVSVQRRFGADMTSSGYSSVRSFSPVGAKGDQRLPAEDPPLYIGSHGGLRNPLMTNSRSTFSSTSSRTSTPSSNNGRGEVKPLPSLSEGQVLPPQSPQPPTAPHGVQQQQQHPWRQVVRTEDGQYLKRSMDERSERSWRSYSSHSSRYSVSGSELSDELLESLPATGGLRNTFAKAAPLPLPESMQSRVPLPVTSMDCGGALDDFPALSGGFPPVSNDITLPLHHFGSEGVSYDAPCLFNDGMPISQSQLLLANGLLSDSFDAGSNMVIGDMTSMATALSCESRHYWEGMLQSAD